MEILAKTGKIVQFMKEKNLSEAEFAKLCDIKESALKKVLTGDISELRYSVIVKIATTIDCKISDLV